MVVNVGAGAGTSSGGKRRHIKLGAAPIAVGGAVFALVQILQALPSCRPPGAVHSDLLAPPSFVFPGGRARFA
jgi:hypothetical protein